jgi:hypothetical protein
MDTPLMFPEEWEKSDFEDKATRKAFADWLEERGDWRAEEVRRLWTINLDNTHTYGSPLVAIYSGAVWLSNTPDHLVNTEIKGRIKGLFVRDISPKDWE